MRDGGGSHGLRFGQAQPQGHVGRGFMIERRFINIGGGGFNGPTDQFNQLTAAGRSRGKQERCIDGVISLCYHPANSQGVKVMTLRQLALFLGLNIVVSVAVTLIVLNLWDAGRATPRIVPTPVAASQSIPAASGAGLTPGVLPAAIPIALTPGVLPAAASRPAQYVVQSGDTLSSIARDFDVAVDQLLAANNLTDGDLLSIGQKLVIPGGGASAAAATPTPIRPRPVVTATESIALGEAFVTIREINHGGAPGQEQVVLTNIGAKVNLAGWTLADGEGHKFTFPDLTLLANAEVKVHTARGTNSASDLYWGQADARWGASGTVAYLRDPAGRLIATYRVP